MTNYPFFTPLRGEFSVEQGDLQMRWKVSSKRLKDFHKCIVVPIGSISNGLCRHRAILFKVRVVHSYCVYKFYSVNKQPSPFFIMFKVKEASWEMSTTLLIFEVFYSLLLVGH